VRALYATSAIFDPSEVHLEVKVVQKPPSDPGKDIHRRSHIPSEEEFRIVDRPAAAGHAVLGEVPKVSSG
jgi:hypothetical protein